MLYFLKIKFPILCIYYYKIGVLRILFVSIYQTKYYTKCIIIYNYLKYL